LGVSVGKSTGVNVGEGDAVRVGEAVGVTVGVAVGVAVGVSVPVGVSVGVSVGVWVGVSVGVSTGVNVGEGDAVGVGESVGVAAGVGEAVCVGVALGVLVAMVGLGVGVQPGVEVALSVGVALGVVVPVSVAEKVAVANGVNVGVDVSGVDSTTTWVRYTSRVFAPASRTWTEIRYTPGRIRCGAVTRRVIVDGVNAGSGPVGMRSGATMTPRDQSVTLVSARSTVVWNGMSKSTWNPSPTRSTRNCRSAGTSKTTRPRRFVCAPAIPGSTILKSSISARLARTSRIRLLPSATHPSVPDRRAH